jgi:hypothetical protein
MISSVLPAAWVALQLAAAAAPTADVAWLEPAEHSAVDGVFGVSFRSRYPDLAAARAMRDRDLALLRSAVADMDEEQRRAAADQISARLEAVRTWERDVARQLDGEARSFDAAVRATDARDLLSLEASTLELQLGLLAPEADREVGGFDRIAIADDVVVEVGEVVRDAVAVGGDVVVRGRVTKDVVAVLGDIIVEPGGAVAGDTIVVGGRVRALASTPPTPVPDPPRAAWVGRLVTRLASILSLAGAGVLTLAIAPQRIDRVAGLVAARPAASAIVGVLGSLALMLGSALLAITLVGIPIALLVLAGLALAWLIGLVAVCQWLGDLLPIPAPHGRWAALTFSCVALSSLSSLPAPVLVLTIAACAVGTGASLISRLGAPG